MSTHYVAAMQAKMGDWTYYITKMKFGELEQVKLAEQIHPEKDLDSLIQRELSGRVEAMTDFLLHEKQHFYGALVIAVYKGNPTFRPVKIQEDHDIVDKVDHSFGLLQFDGSQTYYALDGQHRLQSIKDACDQNPDLKAEEVTVIVLQHATDKAGMQRTRRLFTKLNRYAKKTDDRTNISIDEDDCVAILTRQLVREHKQLKGLVKIDKGSKQLRESDKAYLASLGSLYEANLSLLQAYDKDLKIDLDYQARRPDDELLVKMFKYLAETWNTLLDGIPILKKIVDGAAQPGTVRGGDDGGSIWVRPNVQLIIAECIKLGLLDGMPLDEIVKRLAKLPEKLDQEPWVKIIWNDGTKHIIGGKAERSLLVDIVCHAAGMAKPLKTLKDLKETYGGYYEKKSKELPKFV